jgi:hypothetical protein
MEHGGTEKDAKCDERHGNSFPSYPPFKGELFSDFDFWCGQVEAASEEAINYPSGSPCKALGERATGSVVVWFPNEDALWSADPSCLPLVGFFSLFAGIYRYIL